MMIGLGKHATHIVCPLRKMNQRTTNSGVCTGKVVAACQARCQIILLIWPLTSPDARMQALDLPPMILRPWHRRQSALTLYFPRHLASI